jgi:hypothetical protein
MTAPGSGPTGFFGSALKDDTRVMLLKQMKNTLPNAAFIKNTRSDLRLT